MRKQNFFAFEPLFYQQIFDKAREDTQGALTLAPLSVDGFLLLGMIARWQKQPGEAILWFKKALYIHTDCWPAHYYLAGLYREDGNFQKASREYQLVLNQLENQKETFSSMITILLSLPKAEIRLLCRYHLQNITDTAIGRGGFGAPTGTGRKSIELNTGVHNGH